MLGKELCSLFDCTNFFIILKDSLIMSNFKTLAKITTNIEESFFDRYLILLIQIFYFKSQFDMISTSMTIEFL